MSVQTIQVFLSTQSPEILVGTLAHKNKKLYFEYDKDFLNTGIELSPYKLPLKAGLHQCDDVVFSGLFGVFADSMPDGWGRLLLDRHLMSQGINQADISPLDRLGYIGAYGVGALTYKPIIKGLEGQSHPIHLDTLAQQSMRILNNDTQQDLRQLLALGGSSAGARPKILVQIGQNDNIISGVQTLQKGYKNYLIKFPSTLDPKDIGKQEYQYSLMAKAAGVQMPETKLLQGKYFAVERFDRVNDKRVHIHSVAGLVHSDFRYPSLDYDDLLALTLHITKDVNEQAKLFRLAAFNLFAHNRDDHAKNFSFILDERNQWKLSPAYDLTYSQGPGGEHSTTYLGEGKNPTEQHLIKLAKKHNINNAQTIISQIRDKTK
ncbi:MAG: type II toxin-antitoxin system HipA family toxin [Candidatus Brocadiales bacterium]|nr:type II toxin-antitoxin system HipA family toxin [Candidatus Brocadiales bacterium]